MNSDANNFNSSRKMVKKTWFYMQNKMKIEKEKLSKMKMKNAAVAFKFDKYVAAYLCIRPSQYLSI